MFVVHQHSAGSFVCAALGAVCGCCYSSTLLGYMCVCASKCFVWLLIQHRETLLSWCQCGRVTCLSTKRDLQLRRGWPSGHSLWTLNMNSSVLVRALCTDVCSHSCSCLYGCCCSLQKATLKVQAESHICTSAPHAQGMYSSPSQYFAQRTPSGTSLLTEQRFGR